MGRNCTDRPAAENAADPSLSAYTCSPCPTGYQDDGTKCEGKNRLTSDGYINFKRFKILICEGIVQQMGHCIGGNFNIHIWA